MHGACGRHSKINVILSFQMFGVADRILMTTKNYKLMLGVPLLLFACIVLIVLDRSPTASVIVSLPLIARQSAILKSRT